MTYVTKKHREKWGFYSDRANSFDDSEDITQFIALSKQEEGIVEYMRTVVEFNEYYWVPHPDGQYGVDLALVEKDTNKRIANFDLERWSAWKYDFPYFYKAIHFLGRKEKFLNQDVPFFMCYLNYHRDRVLMVEETVINEYPTVSVHFQKKNVTDSLKKIPLNLGNIFGNYTMNEQRLFRAW